MFKKLLDNTDSDSLANKFRRKRFRNFLEYTKDVPPPVTILDVGGTFDFWKQMGIIDNSDYFITILNLTDLGPGSSKNLKFIAGNAADLSQFKTASFGVVFSNSVIEHIPLKENRQKMADEIKRVGKKYFVQTPSFYFPFEPHFLFPCFQFMPKSVKMFFLLNFDMGWFKKCQNSAEAQRLLQENSLLKLKELKNHFRGCRIIKEKYFFLTKSYIAVNS
ncbi:MAG TPA: class I SAM-dependent methyltransferase [Ignavibacteria bacterium]|nr:class I SAM-dependent methyltransferase [Ignavibacteria bacterium]HMQ99155.1 class I SAM-dependent methyltransferase [Ignavibacteria bacterium]